MSRPVKAIYCLYRGDELIDTGTAKELSERRGIKEASIRYMSTPCYRRSIKGREDTCAVVVRGI